MMKVVLISYLCSLISVVENSSHRHFLTIEPLIDQLYARQVLFLRNGGIQKQPRSSETSADMENWIYSRFASRLPCFWIYIDTDRMSVLLKKSNSLFLYVGLDEDVNVNFVKKLKGLTLNFAAPYRVLLFLFNGKNRSSSGYLDLLKQFWQEQLVDVTIIAISSRDSEYRRKIAMIYNYAATIHHYNPFSRVYTNLVLDSSNRLFPAKLGDLHGHRLRMGLVNDAPLVWRLEKTQRVSGFVIYLLDLILRKLNFSVELDFRLLSDIGWLMPNGSGKGMLGELGPKGRLDAIANAFTLAVHYDSFIPVDRTTFILSEKMCALVPLIRKPEFELSSSVHLSLLLIICLVAIIWLASLLLLRRVDVPLLRSSWRPLDISLVTMGSSMSARVSNLRERIVFGCVLLVALFYSSSFLAHLTSLNFDMDAYMRFETYSELDESGLIPVIYPTVFNVTFGYSNDSTLRRLGKKSMYAGVNRCLSWLTTYANVSCILGQLAIRSLLGTFFRSQAKQAEPCFWSAYRVLIMRQGSPFTLSFDRIIRISQESGIDQWWWQMHLEEVSRKRYKNSINASGTIEKNILADNSHKSVFFLLLAGYLLSLVIFFIELIVNYFRAKLQLRWRRLRRRIDILAWLLILQNHCSKIVRRNPV